MITLFNVGKDATFEEIGAIELLRTHGVEVQSILSESATEGDVHAARLVLSHFHVDVSRYEPGKFNEVERLFIFGRSSAFEIMERNGEKPEWVYYSPVGTRPSDTEIQALKENFIDEIFTKSSYYATAFVRELILKANRGVEHKFGYTPFCNPGSQFTKLTFTPKTNFKDFVILQDIPDGLGFCFPTHWKTLCKITTPPDRVKKVRVFNWSGQKTLIAGDIGDPSCKWHNEVETSLLYRSLEWDELADEYSSASVALNVYPAEEPFAFSAVKAMLSGIPVVAGATRAHRDLLRHGETGFLARTEDEAAYLASRFAWEPHLRAEIAGRAYDWVVTKGPGNMDNCVPWWRAIGVL